MLAEMRVAESNNRAAIKSLRDLMEKNTSLEALIRREIEE
jgi:hypothetical protein